MNDLVKTYPGITREEFARLLAAYVEATSDEWQLLDQHGFHASAYLRARDKAVEAKRALEQAVFGDAT